MGDLGVAAEARAAAERAELPHRVLGDLLQQAGLGGQLLVRPCGDDAARGGDADAQPQAGRRAQLAAEEVGVGGLAAEHEIGAEAARSQSEPGATRRMCSSVRVVTR